MNPKVWGIFSMSIIFLIKEKFSMSIIFLIKEKGDMGQKHTRFLPTVFFFFFVTFLVENYWKESVHRWVQGITYTIYLYKKHGVNNNFYV